MLLHLLYSTHVTLSIPVNPGTVPAFYYYRIIVIIVIVIVSVISFHCYLLTYLPTYLLTYLPTYCLADPSAGVLVQL
jgi:hypothetical protein